MPALDLSVFGEIASGGMGSVELGRLVDESGERIVAVKRMHPEYARDIEFVRMFRDETWLMGALSHPNVVGLVGYGEDELGPYLVMDFVDGVALARLANTARRAGEPMAAELVAFVIARAAEGLHAAHTLCDESGKSREIVHRDVTPSNVLVGFDGSVRITDFGIAKAVGRSSQTRTGVIKGKIAYMSPEYASRRPVDGRADLYSLGVVMFELLTGKVPFSSLSDLELLKLVAYASAPPLRSVKPDVDPELAAIVDRLLAKSPDERPTNGAELARELDAWLESRDRDPDSLVIELAALALHHGGSQRKELKKLLEDDMDTLPVDGSGPKRPKLAALATRTFTLFQHPPPPQRSEPLRPREEDDRPRTRKVAMAGFANAPRVAAPAIEPESLTAVLPPDAATTVEKPPASVPPPARASVPPPARASVPPPAMAVATRRRTPPALLGIAAGAGVALILLLLTLLAVRPRVPDTAPLGEPLSSALPSAPAASASAAPSALPAVPDTVGVEALETEPSARPAPRAPPGAGKPVRPAAKVSGTPAKGSKPCTPASFDYPACLRR